MATPAGPTNRDRSSEYVETVAPRQVDPTADTGAPITPIDRSLADALDIEGEEATRIKAPRTRAERDRRRRWWIIGTLGILAMTVVAAWWGISATTGKPTWRNVAWHVVDARSTEVTYEVNKPADMTVRCLLQAQEVAHGVVGSQEVTLGPGQSHIVQQTTLRTSSLAVIGQIISCHEAD